MVTGGSAGAPSPEAWLSFLAASHSERRAARLGKEALDYAGLAARAQAARDALLSAGLLPGDGVAILAPPSLAGLAVLHAMIDRGIVMLPLNARLSRLEQAEAIAMTGARFVMAEAADAASLFRELNDAKPGLSCGLLAIGTSSAPIRSGVSIELLAAPRGEGSLWQERRDRLRAERAALILMTSGTTGRAKAAVLRFEHLVASATASAELLGSRAQDRWLLCMPLFHIGGLSILIRCALVGAEVVIHPRFEAGAVARALEEERISHVSFVATMLARVLEARRGMRSPESLALLLLGGGPAPESLLAEAGGLGYPIAPTYGLTEAASQVATRPPAEVPPQESDRAGGLRPLPGTRLRIVDEAGRALAPGQPGMIEVRGPTVMSGYLEDPKATAQAIRAGWLVTGDYGWLDDEGRLRVLDRRSDLIVSGGENIYPAEVESVLSSHESVAEAGVYGVADAEFGSRAAAVVVLRPGAVFDPDSLADHCRAQLASYKCPVRFESRPALPRTATGKLQRARLAEPGPS